MRNILIVVFIVIISPFYLFFGQTTPYSYSLNKITGLPSDMIFDVYRDGKNMTWFATSKGIIRFDGVQIKNYNTDELSTRAISNISEDSYNRIWFQDFLGNIFYIENEVIKPFIPFQANGFLKYGIIKNQLFITGKQSVNIYSLKDFRLLKSIKANLKNVKHSVRSGNDFYIIGDKIQKINTEGKITEIKIPEEYIKKIEGPLPIGTSHGLYLFSKFTNQYLKFEEHDFKLITLPFKTSFTQNANVINDKIFFCTTKGLYEYLPEKREYNHYFPEKNISYITKNNSNNYWVTTLNEGAFFVENFKSVFVHTENAPVKLSKGKGKLYFSTNKDEIFAIDESNLYSKIYKGNSDHTTNPLYIDTLNNRILFANSKFNIKTKTKHYQNITSVKSIIQLDAKYYAIASSGWNGIIFIDPKLKSPLDSKFKNLPYSIDQGIHHYSIIDQENGKEVIYDKETDTFYWLTNYGLKKYHQNRIYTLSKNTSASFLQIANVNGKIFVLGQDGKIYALINDEAQIVKLPSYFANENIIKIKVSKNKLFLFKNHVIYSFDPIERSINKTIDIPKDYEINDISIFNNQLYFASNKGIIITKLDNSTIISPVKLLLNNIKVNNRTVTEEKLQNLDYRQNNIEIHYDIISDTPNNNYNIKYSVNNKNWQNLQPDTRALIFTELSYGKHIVELKIENGTQTIFKKFKINITPPFWKNAWFILSIITFIIIGGYLYFKRIVRRIKTRNKLLLEQAHLESMVNHTKLKSLKSQMNPHFFFNALNTLQSFILNNEKMEAINYLSRFSKLTRNILEMSDRENISISDEIETLKNYLELEKTRFTDDFEYEIQVEEKININTETIPTLLLQPFVENAIKHGLLHRDGEKSLIINFIDKNQFIEIRIEDNGIGREKSTALNAIKNKNHKSFATKSLDQRISLLNHSRENKIKLTYIDKKEHSGTVVILMIPKSYTS